MKTLTIHGSGRDSQIVVGGRLKDVASYIPDERIVVISDENVAQHYRHEFPSTEAIVLGTGERIKNLSTAQAIYRRLIELEADRSTFIVGIGGGIVCDITGFVASTFMRGLHFGFVASTLLAQVDAGIGGKNGVNLDGFKNMVGTFNQPQFVICDLQMLATLPPREIACGMAEIVKHAAIADPGLFAFLQERCRRALELDPAVLERLVFDSAKIKSAVVNQDEREAGERRKLNFGHTFGHAIETLTGVSHGEAVSAGMAIAAAISVKLELLPPDDAEQLKELLMRLNLPIRVAVDLQRIAETLGKDKKRAGDNIHLVLLQRLGEAVVKELPLNEVRALVQASDSLME
jgi:3-dehydroquinate synthase